MIANVRRRATSRSSSADEEASAGAPAPRVMSDVSAKPQLVYLTGSTPPTMPGACPSIPTASMQLSGPRPPVISLRVSKTSVSS